MEMSVGELILNTSWGRGLNDHAEPNVSPTSFVFTPVSERKISDHCPMAKQLQILYSHNFEANIKEKQTFFNIYSS